MKKCLSLLIALSMLLAMCVLPVSAETEVPAWTNLPEGAKLIFAENFEEGYATGNLLEAGKTAVEITRTTDNAKVLKFEYQDSEKQTASVVAGPENFSSKVLKLTSSQAKADGYLGKYIYLNNGNAITRTADTQLVVEYDIMVDPKGANFASNDSPLMSFGTTTTGDFPFMATSYGNKSFAFRRGTYAENDLAAYPQYKQDWYVAGTTDISSKASLKYVIEEKDNFDTTRYYRDNALLTTKVSSKLENDWNRGKVVKDFTCTRDKWYPVNGYENTDAAKAYPDNKLDSVDYIDFEFLYSKLASGTAGTDVVLYLDNIKVYEIPAINFTGLTKSEGVQLSEGVVVNFDQPFNATTDTFKVSVATDETNTWVNGAVTGVTMSPDKKSAVISLDAAVLGDNTEFKLWIDDEFTSEAGAIFHKDIDGVLPSEEYVELADFATLVPFVITEAPESISGLIPNDPRTVTIKTNAAIASVDAAYTGGEVKTSTLGTSALVSFVDIEKPVDGTLTVTIKATDNQSITKEIPVTAAKDEPTYIYNDDLSGYAKGSLITDGTKTSYTNQNLVFNTNATDLATAGTASIETDDVQGNVLKLTSTTGSSKKDFSVTRIGDQSSVSGKVLVLKTKYYFPSTYASYDTNRGAAASLAKSLTATGTGNTPDFRLRSNGGLGYNSGEYRSTVMEKGWTLTTDTWTEVVTVIDQTRAGTLNDPHTSRRYEVTKDGTEIIHYVEAWDYGAGETSANKKLMYDVPPNGYNGIWDFSAQATGKDKDGNVIKTGDGTTAFSNKTMYGTYTDIMPSSDTQNNYIMIDDFKAFYADKFAVTSVSENASAFVPTKHTLKIVLNQKIDKAQLSELKLLDDTGAAVEGYTAEVANGGYAIDITLPVTAEVGKTYSVVVTPLFHDITSYQGLATNNKDKEIATVTVAEFTAFTATGYQAEINGFVNGKTTKTDITLSVPTSLTDTDATTAFKVVNDEGTEVTEGWTAKVSEDQKTITLDFTNLETDNYTVTSTDKLVNKDGDKLEGNAVKITITAKQDKIMLFEEDFDGNGKGTSEYTIGANWLDKIPEGEKQANYNAKWAVYSDNADTTTKVSVENTVPATGTKLSGNFLKVYAPTDSTNTYYTNVKGLIPELDESLPEYKNKVIVMETDFYATSIANGMNPMLPSFNTSVAVPTYIYMKHDGNGLKYEGTWLSGDVTDPASAMHTRWTKYMPNADGSRNSCKNGTFTTVIDQRNEVDTVKTLFDGVQLVEKSNTLLTDHMTYQKDIYEVPMESNNSTDYFKEKDAGNLQGFIIYGKNAYNKNDNVFYVDNIKVYLVDAFEIEGVEGASTAFNTAKDTVKLNFTNKVKSLDNAKANIKVTDVATGNPVAYTVSLAEGDYQVVVDIDDSVTGELKIEVSPEIQDEFGQPLAHKYEWYDYKSEGGTGWVTTVKDKTAINGFYTTKAAAEAAAGTTLDVYEYTWGAATNGVITDFKANMTTTSGTFNANGYFRSDKKMNLVTVIKTTKSTSLYAEATAATVDGTSVSTSLTFTNPEEEPLDVWYIVAAYGEYNEMLGCKSASLSVAKGTLEPIAVNFTAKSSDVKSVKVYIWDGYQTMVPYQEAEEIYPAVAE